VLHALGIEYAFHSECQTCGNLHVLPFEEHHPTPLKALVPNERTRSNLYSYASDLETPDILLP
jgi:hypothetical protein